MHSFAALVAEVRGSRSMPGAPSRTFSAVFEIGRNAGPHQRECAVVLGEVRALAQPGDAQARQGR